MKKQYLVKTNAKIVVAKPRINLKLKGYKAGKGAYKWNTQRGF